MLNGCADRTPVCFDHEGGWSKGQNEVVIDQSFVELGDVTSIRAQEGPQQSGRGWGGIRLDRRCACRHPLSSEFDTQVIFGFEFTSVVCTDETFLRAEC